MNCYEVVRHYKGKSRDFDVVVTAHYCLTKDEAEELAHELNNRAIQNNAEYQYFWRMRA